MFCLAHINLKKRKSKRKERKEKKVLTKYVSFKETEMAGLRGEKNLFPMAQSFK